MFIGQLFVSPPAILLPNFRLIFFFFFIIITGENPGTPAQALSEFDNIVINLVAMFSNNIFLN